MYAGIGSAKLKIVQYILSDILLDSFFPSACTLFATSFDGKRPGSHILGLPCKAFLVFLTLLLFKVKVPYFAGHTHRILLQ